MLKKLTIIGVGLIGGSLARALRAAGVVEEVVGFGRTPNHLQQAVELGVIDRAEVKLAEAVKGADVVVLAVPVGIMPDFFDQLGSVLEPPTVLTDVGSVKGQVVAAAKASLADRFTDFVPGHPIAGAEYAGVAASKPELFQDQRVILTPVAETDMSAVARVRQLWERSGAVVEEMDVNRHDQILAACSHLPHALAFTLVDNLVRRDDYSDIFKYAAGGFRDFTRIASSDPTMWRDICVANDSALAEVLKKFRLDLDQLIRAIEKGDGRQLMDIFERAKQARDRFVSRET